MRTSLNVNIAGGLAAVVAAVALLLAAPFIADALAITPAQQSAKAEGQAAFQCFAHSCSGKKRLAAVPKGKQTWYAYRYYNMRGVRGRNYSRCDQWIVVSTAGAVGQFRFQNCR